MSGDIVTRVREIAAMAENAVDTGGREEFDPRGVGFDLGTAADLITTLTAERDALATIARNLTKGLVQLTPSGSEYFTRHGEEYYADVEACQRVVRDRFATGHRAKIDLVDTRRALSTALLQVEALARALDEIRTATDADDPESYRSDDREGCLDTVHSLASEAIRLLGEAS